MNKLFRHFLFVFIPVLSILVVGCKDDAEDIPAPDITAVSPTQAMPGATVTITGTNLANATSVRFGTTGATISNNTATTITTSVPASLTAGQINITVVTAGGSDTHAFTVLGEVDDTPKITGVQPNVGDVGTMVSISGSNFTGATEVSIGNTQIQNFEVAQGGNTITFTVPESATVENFTGRFTVVTPEGTVTSAENVIFTFQEVVLSITAVNPAMGGVGTTVTISGTKFAGATSLMIGDTEIQEFDVNEAGNAITFTVPETATSENFSGRFTVVAPGGEVTSAENIMFTFGEVSNVVVYLPFDGDAEDASGNENDATLVDGGTFEDGVVGEALVFNGENHVLFPTGILSTLEEMTISTYVQLSESTVWVRLFDFGSSQDVYAFLPAQGPDGDIRFVLKNSGAEEILMPATTGDGTLVVGEWYHIAVTLKEGVGILYLNGVEIGRKDDFTIKPSDLGETTQNYIGKSQYPDPLLKAMVDEFRIYNEALTPEQIEELASDLQ